MHIVVICKRQYTNKDVIDDRYGRLWEIPAALARRGHSVTAICLSYQARTLHEESFSAPGGGHVRWHSVNLGRLRVPGFLRYLWLVRKTVLAERPEVIWSASDSIYTILGEHTARRIRRPVVTDLYDNFEYFAAYRVPFVRRRFRRAVRDSDGVTCVSHALQQHVRGDYGRAGQTAVVTNAVDTSLFRPMDKAACRRQLGLPANAMLAGAAGDISNYRGADMLYQAFVGEQAKLGDAMLVVAGFRNDDTQVPAADNIIDLGRLQPEQVPVFLNCLDVAIIYNRSSIFGDFCFPQKFFEAVACELPVVVARVGELGGLLQDQPELFYEDGDTASLVKTIKRQLHERQRATVAVPSWDDQAALLEELLETVVDGTGS